MQQLSSVLAGFQQSLLPEVEAYWCENRGNPEYLSPDKREIEEFWLKHPPAPELLRQEVPQRRNTPEPKPTRKRVQVGWIEERKANPKREHPTTCYYYCCYLSEQEVYGCGSTKRTKKQKVYVQVHIMSEVSCMVRDKRPYTEILKFISERQTKNVFHHTKEREWG